MLTMTNQRAIILLSQMYLPSFDNEEIDALTKAIEVLTEQEPWVLTIEEVMQYIGYSEKNPPREWEKLPLWTESRNGTGVISGYRDVENLRNLIDMDEIDETYIAYKHWRCWSARPTDEQRGAVPWDD